MIKVKFNDESTYHTVQFYKSDTLITLVGIANPDTSGFSTYRLNGDKLGTFDEYTTIFEKGPDYIRLSNDGSKIQEQVDTNDIVSMEERLDAMDSAIGALAEMIGGTAE